MNCPGLTGYSGPVKFHPHAAMFITEDFFSCRSVTTALCGPSTSGFSNGCGRMFCLPVLPQSGYSAWYLNPWSRHRLRLLAVQFTCHHLPFRFRFACGCPVSAIRRPGHISANGLFRAPLLRCFASHPSARGKVLPVGTLETSGVVIHFIRVRW